MKKNIIEMNQTQSDSTKLLYSTFPVHINFKKLSDKAIAPRRGSDGAAGYDLYAAISTPITIAPHTTMMVPTDIAMEIPNGYFGAIFARSGLATKQNLRPANCVGVIDSDYRGNIYVPLHNDGGIPQSIAPKERIAQFILMPAFNVDFQITCALDDTERADGGFGSTGK